jgi:AraC-like DNA-binding protein
MIGKGKKEMIMHDGTHGLTKEGMHTARSELGERIARWTEGAGPVLETAIPGLSLMKYEAPTEPMSYMYEPCICLVAQGTKRVFLGDEEYVYDANHYLITSVGLPVVANVTEASEEVPLLGLVMKLELNAVAQLLVDSQLPLHRVRQSSRGIAASQVSPQLFEGFIRLIGLLEEPSDIPILAPLLQKEILYRLLVGDQGERLRQIVMAGSHGHQIARALDWLKENYTKPLRVDDLASHTGMSTSTFHHHFRNLTSMSPLQFQKSMRLHEARRLMLAEKQDAANAAFLVGYESPSQFTREYKRQFGATPLRDIKNLQQIIRTNGRIEAA